MVSRTSKYLRAVAEPLLYANIKWSWEKTRPPPINFLMSKLMQRQDLTRRVKSLAIAADYFDENLERSEPLPEIAVAQEQLAEFAARVDAMGVSDRDAWIAELERGSMDALVALLLSQLPNLTSFHLEGGAARESRFLGQVLNSALCSRNNHSFPTFWRLRDVLFQPPVPGELDQPPFPGNVADVLSFFYLPALQRLVIGLDSPPLGFAWPGAAHPECSNLTTMSLSGVREGPLGQILSCTRHLRTLHWEWWYHPVHHGSALSSHRRSPATIDLKQIAADLSHVRATLESLTIWAECGVGYYEGDYPALGIRGSLNALTRFEKLKFFEVPTAFLLGFAADNSKRLEDFIPRNIEHLVLQDDLWSLEGQYTLTDQDLLLAIEDWLERRRDSREINPCLLRFTLLLRHTDEDDEEWRQSEQNQLKQLFFNTGVELSILKYPFDPHPSFLRLP